MLRMRYAGLKERIENHPVVVFGGIAVGAFAAGFGTHATLDSYGGPSESMAATRFDLSGSWEFRLEGFDAAVGCEAELPGAPVGSAVIDQPSGYDVFSISGTILHVEQCERLQWFSDFATVRDSTLYFHYRTTPGDEGLAVATLQDGRDRPRQFTAVFQDFAGKTSDANTVGSIVFERLP